MNGNSWAKWSAIAEILSSVAIVGTLIYLAVQTQQNTDAMQGSTQQTMLMSDLAVLQLAPKEDLSGKDELTDEEKGELQNYLVALARSREFEWFQYRRGQLGQDLWESYLQGLVGNLSYPRTRAWWDYISRNALDREFVATVNDALSTTPVRTDLRHNFDIAEEQAR